MQSDYQKKINNSLKELSDTKSISSALLVCNTLLEYMGIPTKSVEDIELSKFKLPNSERYDNWFDAHPHFRGDRACFEITTKEEPMIEAKFFALKKKSRLFIAGSVGFTPNFEDRDYTRRDPSMKVGIDFFLTPEKDSVIVVLSNKSSLRLVELSGRLTNTQNEIFNKWDNIIQTEDKNVLHLTMWESFKLSSLNKKFYEGITNSFLSLTQYLQKNNVEEQLANQFANRLHGRLLFLWFLRKKKIINESKEYFVLNDQNDTKYYANTLSELFFNVLNNEDHKEFDSITPYLNGGLFDQNSDGEYWNNHKPTFPTGFFKTLYEHFDSFNFTTDESTPESEQIAIDPEMLGRIFESFLATLTTETGAQAKKANGAFYTPREIVSYMSRESLRQYLYTKLKLDMFLKESIDKILDMSDSEWALSGSQSKNHSVTKENREKIMDALRAIKVLDPAVGSGAFPMGILHKILSLFERLEPNFESYETKLSILKNNLYGVDIDPTAIEICRLRAWLSIIVDVKDIKKIKPLPNLDFKFVCAHSLIGLDVSKQESLLPSPDLKATLIQLRDEYYATSNKAKKEKLQKEYIKLTHKNSLFDTEEIRQLKSYQPFETGKSASFYDPELMHGVESFDVVIGNPPYVNIVRIPKKEREIYKRKYTITKNKVDLYAFFIERSENLLKTQGVISFIIPQTWKATDSFSKLREFIFKKFTVKEIVNLEMGVFTAIVRPLVMVLKKEFTENHKIIIRNPSFEVISEININEILNSGDYSIDTESNFEYKNLFRKIESQSTSLGEVLQFTRGIKTSNDKRFISKENKTADHKKVFRGRNIKSYTMKWAGEYIWYRPDLMREKVGCLPHTKALFEVPVKLITQRVNSSMQLLVAIDFESNYFLDTTNVSKYATLNKNYSIVFLLGLLNSKLINFWYSENYRMPTIGLYELHSVPIKQTKYAQEKIVTLVQKIIDLKNIDIETDISEYRGKIDNFVYELYGLSEEEVKVIENS